MDGHDIPLIKFNVCSSYVKYFVLNDYVEQTLKGLK